VIVSATSVRGEVLAPGKSALVVGELPYSPPVPGTEFRYRAELVDRRNGAVVGTAALSSAAKAASALLPAVGVAGAVAAIAGRGGGAATASGAGTMVGEHEAQRAGDQWVEHGSGVIDVTTTMGRMILNYQYDSTGPSAAELNATATATGELTTSGGGVLAVTISSATAQMVVPGDREQTGSLIHRTGAVATGTFTGTVGGAPWSGLLTMTEGDQTLDLSTNAGAHQFNIRFTASQ
jgi:hypothetical protein